MHSLVLRGVRLIAADRNGPGDTVDVGIDGGLIAAVAPAGSLAGSEIIDAEGRLCTPAFVDGHVHLDKAFLSEIPAFGTKVAGPFFEELAMAKRTMTEADVTDRMRRALQLAVLAGTGTMRAQIDVDDVIGLTNVRAALALRDEWSPRIRIQVVVFPQEGVAGNPAAREVVEEALRLGADVMGGAHGFDRAATPAEHYRTCFELAAAAGIDLDLHLDFDATPATPLEDWDVWQVAHLADEFGYGGRVTVAHLTKHGGLDAAARARLAALLLDHGIGLTVVPGPELQSGRTWTDPPIRSVEDVTSDYAAWLEAGVPIACASGHFADAFHPVGRGDLLRETLLLASARNLGDPVIGGCHVLDLATRNAAAVCGLPGPHGITPGALADCIVFDAADADLAVRHQADRWLVVHGGTPVATTRTIKELR